MERRRVVITGLGVMSPVGCTVEKLWSNLLEGRSGVSHIRSFDTSEFEVHIAAEADEFDVTQYLQAREVKRLDRYCHMGIAAADVAVRDAGLELDRLALDRIGVIMGSGVGGLQEIEQQHRRLFGKGPSRVSPFFIPKMMLNALPGQISIRFGLRGPNFAVASACSSANHAIGQALRSIQVGEADVVLTGGSEAAVSPSGLAGFQSVKALSHRNDEPEKASRPFERNRDGFVLGEGAACLILESLESARARGARIYAELVGFGNTADAHHITAPDPQGRGAAECMLASLRDGGVEPREVSYVNAHGTSTPLNDPMETRALKIAFGAHAHKLAISSTKSMIGHLLGGAGAVELVATVLSCVHDVVHPTINYEEPDPECDLDYVPNEARTRSVAVAISNGFGFGGHNTTLVLRKYRD